MERILRDVRLALRRLRMAPGFTLFAVASLALGIGVSTVFAASIPISPSAWRGLAMSCCRDRSFSCASFAA